jgi:hypothetical protein
VPHDAPFIGDDVRGPIEITLIALMGILIIVGVIAGLNTLRNG